ncbi:hypothetical protein AKO1_015110 [Acrasis kona]|uniref:Uncharacterized protein n=1 Tax=Acrasis kona TaxID=1008807 RepID=A0AAW2YPI6_9EUKA
MTSLSSFGEAVDLGTLSSPIRPQPIHLRSAYASEMVSSASTNSLTDYVDSSTLLKSASSGSLSNLHTGSSSLLNKSFSSSSFSRFQEELEDDEEYNRKYHGAHATINMPTNHDPDHSVVMRPHMLEDVHHRTNQQYLPPMMNTNPMMQNEQEDVAQPQMLQQQQQQQHVYSVQQQSPIKQPDLPFMEPPYPHQQQQQAPQRKYHEQLSQSELNAPNRLIVQYGSEQYTSIDGRLYNDRGYKICGHLNQHNKPCQRIGRCPFHDKFRTEEASADDKDRMVTEQVADGDDQLTNNKDSAFTKKPRKKKSDGHMIPMNDMDHKLMNSAVMGNPSLGGHAIMPPSPSSNNSASSTTPMKKVPFKQGWNKDEHMRFLTGLQQHGKGAWKEIATIVGTRTPTQIQSHAQKYFLRQKQKNKNKRSIHDFTMDDLNRMAGNENYDDEDATTSPTAPKRKQRKRKAKEEDEEEDEEEETDMSQFSPNNQQQQMQQQQQQQQQPLDNQQQAIIQSQVQQILQGSLSQLLATNGNREVDNNALLALFLQNKIGDLYRQQQQQQQQQQIQQQNNEQHSIQLPQENERLSPNQDGVSNKRQRTNS